MVAGEEKPVPESGIDADWLLIRSVLNGPPPTLAPTVANLMVKVEPGVNEEALSVMDARVVVESERLVDEKTLSFAISGPFAVNDSNVPSPAKSIPAADMLIVVIVGTVDTPLFAEPPSPICT